MRAGIRGAIASLFFLLLALVAGSVALAVGTLAADVDHVWFGTGTGPVTESIVLSNDDPADPVDVTNVVVTGTGFSSPAANTAFTVSEGTNVTVDVTWTGAPADQVTGNITFENDGAGGNITVPLAHGQPYTLSTTSIDLANVNIAQPELDPPLINQDGMNSHSRVRWSHSGPGFPDVVVTVEDVPSEFIARAPGDTLTATSGPLDYRVGFNPIGTGFESGSVVFSAVAGAETFNESVTVTGTGVTGDALYRVNSGGGIVDHLDTNTQSFTLDTAGNRSPFYIPTDDNQTTDGWPSPALELANGVPTGTPPEIFQSERFDDAADGNNLTYLFPLEDPGTYTVRLYFAENAGAVNSPGDRLFDVEVEGSLVLDDLDVYAETGGKTIGMGRAFLVEADTDIDIEFLRGAIQNPFVNAVEVVTGGNAQLSAPDVDFGAGLVGGTAITETVTITNTAPATGPAVRIDSASLSGSHPGDFDANLAAPVWIAPGDTFELDVTYQPSAPGSRSAALNLGVWGDEDLVVNLAGTAQVPSGTLSVTPTNLPFGSVNVGGSSTGTVTVTNSSGNQPILITDVTIAGSSASSFSVVGDAPDSVAVGASDELTVRFAPSAAGSATATLRIDHSGTNKSSAVSLSGTGTEPLPPGGDPFTDDDESIFETDIEWLAGVGITRGCNPPVNDLFCPNDNVTRGQMAAFFVRAMGLTDDGGGDLFDDDDGSVFEGDIDRFGTAGITRGCNPPDNNLYCPNDNVTRGQMAAFFVRAFGLSDDGGGDLFGDDDSSVFEADIDRLATAGITRGCNPPINDEFCPEDNVTRGQMAAFFHRAADLLGLPS